ncbi:MAG: sigma-70 family RNA polymerase sigma factor [Sphingomonadales bacterium]|nr:sigma-70 family RNA polymerase sigma factor [Sphingomonadales bacterium]
MSKIIEAFLANEQSVRRVIARYCPRTEDIDELTQETFLKCFAAELRSEVRDPKGLLLHAAKNVALGEIRKKRHKTTDYLEDSQDLGVLVDEAQISPEVQLDGRRKLVALTRALSVLPPDDQRMLLMRKVDKLKFKQIARRMDVSVNTVQRRIAAALLKCGVFLREQGYDPMEFGAVRSHRGQSKTPRVAAIGSHGGEREEGDGHG